MACMHAAHLLRLRNELDQQLDQLHDQDLNQRTMNKTLGGCPLYKERNF